MRCYDGQSGDCTSSSIHFPITQIATTTTLDNQSSKQVQFFNASGLPTELDEYDYGASAAARKTITTYASLGNNITAQPSSVTVYDGPSGYKISKTTYGYDEYSLSSSGVSGLASISGSRGNRTSQHEWNSQSGATEDSHWQYDDAGQVVQSQDPSGVATNTWTTYGHDSTDTYITSTTPPTPSSGVSLPTSATYDPTTGLMTSTTDPNGTKTKYSYDSMLRVTEIDNLDSSSNMVGKQTYGYTPTKLSFHQYQNADAYSDTEIQYDGYGRQSRLAIANGQFTNSWYLSDLCYNSMGQVGFQSSRYQGSGFDSTTKVCSGAGDAYTYDALARPLSVTHGDGTAVNYSYTGRATETTDENGVSRITQVDGLGRTTAVCEISSSTLQGDAPAPCGLDIAGTGFATTYAYSLQNRTTTITQGAQTRTFQTDSLGRTILTQEPERGQTTYSYAYSTSAGLGLTLTRKRPTANQTNPSVLTTTTTQYDSMGRVVTVSYTDGRPTKTFNYDASSGWAQAQSYVKGRLGGARVNPLVNNWSGEIFSYDAMGNVAFTGLCFPYGCGNSGDDKYVFYNHDWLGNLTSENDGGTAGNIGYSYSTANEITQITGSYEPNGSCCGTYNLVTGVQNGPNGPISYQLANGLSISFSYDSMGKRNGGWVFEDSTQRYGYSLTWKGTQEQGLCDTVLNRCESFGYDEFNRLSSQNVNAGTVQNYSYVYDRYGNRWQENLTAGSGPQPQLLFNKSNNHVSDTGYIYDAAGNVIADGVHTFTYDAEGNLTKVDSGNTASYAYDALNRRIRVQNSSQTVDFTFDYLNRRLTTWQESNNFGISGKIYWADTQMPIAFRAINGITYFEHQDWMGTERLRTDNTGAVGASYFSLPFGDDFTANVIDQYADQDNAHFAQLDSDYFGTSEGGNAHAQYRDYSEGRGYWLSPDPYDGSYDFTNPQSLNRYSYVLNNPLSFTDPTGQECVWDDGSFDAADDRRTRSAEGCTNQGGHWVDPHLFENAMLTNGQWHSNNGDWSDQANANLAANWVTPSTPVTASPSDIPLSDSFIFIGMSRDQLIAELKGAGFAPHTFDDLLGATGAGHSGRNLRDSNPTCSIHLTIDPGSGQRGQPVSGTWHIDEVNPYTFPSIPPLGSMTGTIFHASEDVIPDIVHDKNIDRSIIPGNRTCPHNGGD